MQASNRQRLILAGGGDAPESGAIDNLFTSLLRMPSILYLPQAVSPRIWSEKKALEWMREHSIFDGINIEVARDLESLTIEDMKRHGAVYIMGGNTFDLVAQLRAANAHIPLQGFIADGGLVYGLSAGAILLGASIRPATIGPEADSNDVGLSDLSGLGCLGRFSVTCHYESSFDRQIVEYVSGGEESLIAIHEAGGLYIEGDKALVVGEPACVFSRGKSDSHSWFGVLSRRHTGLGVYAGSLVQGV
jgi:dipeptidase E